MAVRFRVETRDGSVRAAGQVDPAAVPPAFPDQLSGQVAGRRQRLRFLRRGILARVVVGVINVFGEGVDPASYYFRVAVYLETSAPRLALLERSLFVAAAVRGADSVSYTAYRVT